MKRHGYALSSIRDFNPSYFAMVMATGIASIAFDAMPFPNIGRALFILNSVLYPLFCIMLIARALFFWPNLAADIRDLPRSWPFLTFVVGTNTVGMQLVIFLQASGLASLLWLVALVGWIVCMCLIVLNLVASPRETILKAVNGATLLTVVSTISITLLGARLLDPTGGHADYGFSAIWALWAAGFILYLFVVSWVIHRLFFSCFKVTDWDAPYWICMGAPAIITLAGSEFVIRIPKTIWDGPQQITLWMSFFAWVVGTLWIPYLLVMDVRKLTQTSGSAPLWLRIFPWSRLAFGGKYYSYSPPSWSRVFPMGMYASCTLFLGKASGYRVLELISSYWVWFALLIWSLTLIGTLRSFISSNRVYQ